MKFRFAKSLGICLLLAAWSMWALGCDEESKKDPTTDTPNPDVADVSDLPPEETDEDVPPTDVEPDVTPDVPDVTPDTTPDTAPDVEPDVPDPFNWPDSPQDYAFGPVAYVHKLIIPTVSSTDGPTCCRDWGAISKDNVREGTDLMDNALASLAKALVLFVNVQEMLDEQLEAGSFALLWDHQDFAGGAQDPSFFLVGLFGDYAGTTTYAEASAGNGTFSVSEKSFKPNSGEPLIYFSGASMTASNLNAGPSLFRLTLPLGFVNLDVAVSDAQVTGRANFDGDKISYFEGTLSGYVKVADVVDAVNEIVASPACECLGLTGPLYVMEEDGSITASACMQTAAAHALCSTVDEEICAVLAAGPQSISMSLCTMLPTLLVAQADIDLNGDCATDPVGCAYEALSIGLQWEAVPAVVVEVTE